MEDIPDEVSGSPPEVVGDGVVVASEGPGPAVPTGGRVGDVGEPVVGFFVIPPGGEDDVGGVEAGLLLFPNTA